jgi:hypothetical protein
VPHRVWRRSNGAGQQRVLSSCLWKEKGRVTSSGPHLGLSTAQAESRTTTVHVCCAICDASCAFSALLLSSLESGLRWVVPTIARS